MRGVDRRVGVFRYVVPLDGMAGAMAAEHGVRRIGEVCLRIVCGGFDDRFRVMAARIAFELK